MSDTTELDTHCTDFHGSILCQSVKSVSPFFRTPERIAALIQEAAEWEGTPFFDGIGRRAKKGTAADCVSWIAAALQRVGAIGAVPWPDRYVSCTGGPQMLMQLIDTLNHTERLRCVWVGDALDPKSFTDFMPGDVLAGTRGRSGHHLALYLGDNRIAHSWNGAICEGNVRDTALMKHLHSVWRPMEQIEKS
jgi:cell wall-associated NlpC family hydrolase